MSETTSVHDDLGTVPTPRLSLDEFLAWGRRAIVRADIPVVVDVLPDQEPGARRAAVLERFGDSKVALFSRPRDPESTRRSVVVKIRLREFFEKQEYSSDPELSYRIVTNVRNRPDDVNAILGFDADAQFDYQRPMSSANLWVNYHGSFGRSHFDELENFNIQLEGHKRFVLMPPGYRNYYTRSLLRGFGHHSRTASFDNVDLRRYPRLGAVLPQRRDVVLGPGQMLYLPLGWWHQVESLDPVNLNLNFWLQNNKILRRPYVLADAVYKTAFRKLNGFYNYQPEKRAAEGNR